MMLNVTSLLFFTLLLTTIDLITARPHNRHRRRHRSSGIPVEELSVYDMPCKNGYFNTTEKICNCAIGYTGRHCEKVKPLRCHVLPSQANNHLHNTECPTGQRCMPDKINCHSYLCQSTLGWCTLKASNSERDATTSEESRMDEFVGTEN